MARIVDCPEVSVSAASAHNKYLRLAQQYESLIYRLEFLIDYPHLACSVPVPTDHILLHAATEMWKGVTLLLDIYNASRLKAYKYAQREMADLPTYTDLLKAWGFERPSRESTKYDEYLKMCMRKKRKNEFIAANLLEATEASRRGWFTVFDTLTIDPSKAFAEDLSVERYLFRGRKIEQYFKFIQREILKRLYPGKNATEMQKFVKDNGIRVHDYFRYSLVFEPHKNGAPHAHILMHMKVLPALCITTCPNKGRKKRDNRQVRQFKQFWPHGHSNPIAVRYNMSDSYAGLGWAWPVDKDDKPIKQSDPKQIAFYLSKYMAKERTTWKIRHSQLFGVIVLVTQMEEMDLKTLRMCLTWRKLLVTHYGVTIPPSLLRKSATRLLVKSFLTIDQIFNHVTTYRCRRQLHLHSKVWIPMKEEFNRLSSSNFMIPSMSGMDISNVLQTYFSRS